MNNGWIKIWRKSLENGWLRNHKLWTFWCWCLLKATHKEHYQIVGYQSVRLMPGEFIFGRKASSKELNMSEQEIRTAVDSMRKRKNLTIKSTNKYSIITILNWDSYQSDTININQQTNQPLTSKQPATNHKQECKKEKKEKKEIIYPTLDEAKAFFKENGYKESAAEAAWKYYLEANWHNRDGKKVLNWKQTFRGVWFKDENKALSLPPERPAGKAYQLFKIKDNL